MARKFLYLVACLTVLVIAILIGLRFWAEDLTRLTFEPAGPFEPQTPMLASAYEDPGLWFAQPGMTGSNPAHWQPQGHVEDADAPEAAVFFVHPTSYLARDHWNAPLDDAESQDRARLFIHAMASPFAHTKTIWVPRYRQAAFGAFLSDMPQAKQALDLAYGDLLHAFHRFAAGTPANQPIVLAGHSQGAFHLKRLVAERVAGTQLSHRVVAVYAIGWPVSIAHDLPRMGMSACETPVQTGCVISWLSFAEPGETGMMVKAYARRPALDGKAPGSSAFLCSNPLTGSRGVSASASANIGTLVPAKDLRSGKLVAGMVPARCGRDGFLHIGPGPDMGPYVLPGNNYHVYDIPLFWKNLRSDFIRRVDAWHKTH